MSTRLIFGSLVTVTVVVSAAVAADKPAKPAPAPADPPREKAPAAPQSPDEAALRTALKTLAKGLQEGNRDQIRKVIYAANPTEQKMVDAMSNMAAEIAGLNKAAAKAFGEEQAKALTGDLGAELSRIDEA
jgi:hypothetical protein